MFGGAGEVNSGPQKTMANEHEMLYCATDWTGMATADVPNALIALNDLSRFPILTDRVQQGELNFLYLARLMVHPQGFSANPAFQYDDTHTSFIDTREAFYDGNSQGGIYGGTVCAVSVDVRHCVLGVPGMDYSILLPRSSDYVAQQSLTQTDLSKFNPQDPGSVDGPGRLLGVPRQRLSRPVAADARPRPDPDAVGPLRPQRLRHAHDAAACPTRPSHQVLLQVAYGDHQVANITAETEARTIGAHGAEPPLVAARYGPLQRRVLGHRRRCQRTAPWHGSGITLFDSGPAGYVRDVPVADGGRHAPGHRSATDVGHAEPFRRRPARGATARALRPAAEGRLPRRGRRGHAALRRSALLLLGMGRTSRALRSSHGAFNSAAVGRAVARPDTGAQALGQGG